jgi:predicted enzyme involved in methoxymalonyl-ACP biosynthesis
MFPELYWMPPSPDLNLVLGEIGLLGTERAWATLGTLARTSLNSLATLRLDRALVRLFGQAPPPGLATKPIRLAVLASSTSTHLVPGLRVAALRRGIWLTVHACDYGQYARELMDPSSALHQFRPDIVLFALDALHLVSGLGRGDAVEDVDQRFAALIGRITGLWRRAQETLGCAVFQQTVMPVFPALLGSNEQRLPGSPARLADRLNASLREEADTAGVELVAVDAMVARDGLRAWHDPVLWHGAKQEIHPGAAHAYGDLVGRLIAALQGRSRKCLVLDLDNTLWGGVIGDEGVEGYHPRAGPRTRGGVRRLPAARKRARAPRRHTCGLLEE